MSMETEKGKALDAAVKQIEKDFGKGSIMKLGAASAKMNIETIPTGALSLDIALGVGGIPRGRIIEIYGPESSGKTTVALHMIAEAQKRGGYAAFIDAEHALDPEYARHLGVDIDNLLISQPDTGEQALEICDALVRSGAIDIIVIDSVAALVPKAEIEGDMGDSHVGLQARLMSQALRKLTGIISKSRTATVFINQIREKVGVMFGNPETTTGGRALKFYSTVRMDVRRIESLKSGNDIIGNRTRVKVVKNKVAPPFKQAEFDIMYGEGISHEGCLVDLGVLYNIVGKSGAWYSYGDERIGQGRENTKEFLKNHPEMAFEIENRIREAAGLTALEAAPQTEDILKPEEIRTVWAKPKKMLLTYADAYNFALDRLAMRDHSSLELRDKLAERGCDKELQDRVLAALRERHFVDDVRCAGYVVDAWRRKGIYGRNYLRLMLEKRQIPASVVKDMLDGVSEEEERERAEEFARKEVPKLLKKYQTEPRKGKAALSRKLASRGFTGVCLYAALAVYDEMEEEIPNKEEEGSF